MTPEPGLVPTPIAPRPRRPTDNALPNGSPDEEAESGVAAGAERVFAAVEELLGSELSFGSAGLAFMPGQRRQPARARSSSWGEQPVVGERYFAATDRQVCPVVGAALEADRLGMHGELYSIDCREADRATLRDRVGVALAEDHPLLRRALRQLIDHERDMQVIAEVTEPGAVARQLLQSCPQVLVLDAGMSAGSCLEEVRRLRSLAPQTQIVLMTMQQNRTLADHALTAGAIGFVLKDRADEELCEAVRSVAREKGYRSPRVSET